MTSLLPVLALGFFLGMRHATDPDHVIAVGTIVARHRTTRGAAAIGIVWGVGHSLTILLVGSGIIAFRWAIPARVGLSMELAVGVMLIVLGLTNLRDIFRLLGRGAARPEGATGIVHSHPHSHGDYIHTHPHRHDPEAHPHRPDQTPVAWLDRAFVGLRPYQLARPLLVGVVHGLAGSAAVALLVLAAIENPKWSMLYLLVFGGGHGCRDDADHPGDRGAVRLQQARAQVRRRAPDSSGLVSVAFGCLLTYQIGFVNGLFTGYPHWTP